MQCVIPVAANLEHVDAARQAADTPEAQAERLDAAGDILDAVDRSATRGELARLIRMRLRGERIAGYIDGHADGRRERVQGADWPAAIEDALAEMAAERIGAGA